MHAAATASRYLGPPVPAVRAPQRGAMRNAGAFLSRSRPANRDPDADRAAVHDPARREQA